MNAPAGKPAEKEHDMLKKIVLVAVLASGLTACAQSPAPKEDSRLKEAYSSCINTAEGSPEKIEACQSVLTVLKKEKAHEKFATEENVRVQFSPGNPGERRSDAGDGVIRAGRGDHR
jgi:hypothetical protein